MNIVWVADNQNTILFTFAMLRFNLFKWYSTFCSTQVYYTLKFWRDHWICLWTCLFGQLKQSRLVFCKVKLCRLWGLLCYIPCYLRRWTVVHTQQLAKHDNGWHRIHLEQTHEYAFNLVTDFHPNLVLHWKLLSRSISFYSVKKLGDFEYFRTLTAE